jgi:lysyl-tRNA synthetase class 1
LEEVSGRKLDDQWSPVQVIEAGLLKNRQFVSIDTAAKTITYLDKDDHEATADYSAGAVKLSWRIDWPARWALLQVNAEPFGRDHATKGGSYDTGKVIIEEVFKAEAPYPIPYNFIMKTGDTKKMSKSAGDVVTAADLLHVLPPEIVWFFLLRSSPDKQLFFDQGDTLLRLFDEFAELSAKPDKTPAEQQLLDLCLHNVEQPTVSNVPYSHLVASYQAALRDADRTLQVITRTEHAETVSRQADIIKRELQFAAHWLDNWASDEVKFALREDIDVSEYTEQETIFLNLLSEKVSAAPADADGSWFHDAIYACKDDAELEPKTMFATLYRLLIGKTHGPRAGWFLSILPRDWLIERLRLEK